MCPISEWLVGWEPCCQFDNESEHTDKFQPVASPGRRHLRSYLASRNLAAKPLPLTLMANWIYPQWHLLFSDSSQTSRTCTLGLKWSQINRQAAVFLAKLSSSETGAVYTHHQALVGAYRFSCATFGQLWWHRLAPITRHLSELPLNPREAPISLGLHNEKPITNKLIRANNNNQADGLPTNILFVRRQMAAK